ncbi:MAG: phage head morphogenesis protein [Sulfobacillus sp.]
MKALIREMADNVEYWVEVWRKDHPPELAMDETPSQEIQREFAKLSQQWQTRFDEMAPKVAKQFLRDQFRGTDAAMRQALRDAGWSIEFVLTPAMHDAFEASLAENVGLIRSIASEYLQQVEGIVMRNYLAGRNVRSMAKEIHARFGVSSNRAMLISRDQSNKANAIVQRARQKELKIEEAIWLHSHAGKTPRPAHVKMNGKRYKVDKGMWDSDERAWIFPGELISCFPEDSEVQFADFVSKAYRRFYRGELAEIVTESGKTIRATPNHPVLTMDGWVAIGGLNEGDNVLCVPDDRLRAQRFLSPSSTGCKEDEDGAVATFAQIFRSLAQAGRVDSKISHAAQFHGDGLSYGNVDVVFAARPLTFGGKPSIHEKCKQLGLAVAHDPAALLSAPVQFVRSALRSAHSIVRGFCESTSSLDAFVAHANASGFASATDRSSRKNDTANDGVSGDRIFLGKREHARAVLMFAPQPERIAQVKRVPFEGYVCNLETRHGFYLTGNIIAHNCGCVNRSVLPWTPATFSGMHSGR